MTESLNPMTGTANGITQLNARRARRTRQAPQPRHPKPTTADTTRPADQTPTGPEDTAPEQPAHTHPDQAPDTGAAAGPISRTPDHTGSHSDAATSTIAPTAGAIEAPTAATDQPNHNRDQSPAPTALPTFDVDPTDPTAHIVSPTVLSIPESIQHRFKLARADAPSHTALVLDALRAHAHELPTLILNRRPGLKPGDLFPFREAPGHTTTETPLPLRIRPTRGELAVMKKLAEWASTRMADLRTGTPATNRSEMVAAALDAFLPPAPKRRTK